MKTPSGGMEASTSFEHAAFAPRWWIGNEAATANGRGQVLGDTTPWDAAQWRHIDREAEQSLAGAIPGLDDIGI